MGVSIEEGEVPIELHAESRILVPLHVVVGAEVDMDTQFRKLRQTSPDGCLELYRAGRNNSELLVSTMIVHQAAKLLLSDNFIDDLVHSI